MTRYPAMNEPDFITEELIAVRPDGTRSTVVVRVGKPTKDAPTDDPENNTHVCLVRCDGVDGGPLRVYGEGPMQALHLGLQAVRLYLECAEADDGLRFVWPRTDEPCNWRQFWYDDGRPPAR